MRTLMPPIPIQMPPDLLLTGLVPSNSLQTILRPSKLMLPIPSLMLLIPNLLNLVTLNLMPPNPMLPNTMPMIPMLPNPLPRQSDVAAGEYDAADFVSVESTVDAVSWCVLGNGGETWE